MTDLRSRISRASFAQGATSLLGKVCNLVLGIIVARLLFPEDYGLFAICLIVTGLANLLSNFGFQSYIIQAREADAHTLNTCYTLNFVLSALLGGVVMMIGLFWPNPHPLLPPMLLLYGVHVFVSGLSYIELALLKRELDFTRSSRAELAFTVTSMGARVGFAAAHLGALCFPLGDLLGALVRYIVARQMNRQALRLVAPRLQQSRDALWFGMHSTSIGMASFFAAQTDKLLMTSSFPVASIGLYSFSANVAAMFYNAFIVPQTSVFLATYARLRDDVDAARDRVASSTRLIFSIALAANVPLMLETERIVTAIFTEKWLPAVPLVQVFAIDFIFRSMFSGVVGMQLSFGQAGAAARTKWQSAIMVVAALLLAWSLGAGIMGYAIAYVSGNLVAAVNNVHANGRLLAIRWLPFLRNLLPPTMIAMASTLVWWLLQPVFAAPALWQGLVESCAVWLLSYLGLSALFNRMLFSAAVSMIAASRNRGRGA